MSAPVRASALVLLTACATTRDRADLQTEEVLEVLYHTSADDSMQPAITWLPATDDPVPLLVVLHTWSGDYRQTYHDPARAWCVRHGWAYVHPDFRGPNHDPDATGSDLAIADVLSAVRFVRTQVPIDPDRIYLLGTSGGGHAALLVAGREPEPWAGVSAWCGINDLSAWHRECVARGLRYARDIEVSCGGPPGRDRAIDARYAHRSPAAHLHRARGVAIDINAGIADGHTGSVPVSHSLGAFDRLAREADRIAPDLARELCAQRVPEEHRFRGVDPTYGDKPVLFRRTSGNVRLTIFDGGHEIVFPAALRWLEQQRRGQVRDGRRSAAARSRPETVGRRHARQ